MRWKFSSMSRNIKVLIKMLSSSSCFHSTYIFHHFFNQLIIFIITIIMWSGSCRVSFLVIDLIHNLLSSHFHFTTSKITSKRWGTTWFVKIATTFSTSFLWIIMSKWIFSLSRNIIKGKRSSSLRWLTCLVKFLWELCRFVSEIDTERKFLWKNLKILFWTKFEY